jgi:hypothetical protein
MAIFFSTRQIQNVINAGDRLAGGKGYKKNPYAVVIPALRISRIPT